jgi:hypothetical protein
LLFYGVSPQTPGITTFEEESFRTTYLSLEGGIPRRAPPWTPRFRGIF